MKSLVIGLVLLFASCESPESFHMQDSLPMCESNDARWYYSPCSDSGDGGPAICINETGDIRTVRCAFDSNELSYYCVAKCSK